MANFTTDLKNVYGIILDTPFKKMIITSDQQK